MTSEPSTKERTTPRPSSDAVRASSKVDPPSDLKYNARMEQFDAVIASSRELFAKKNKQYADSIARTGVLGSVVAIAGLSARLEHLVLGAPDAGKSEEEIIVDIVKDILNYAAITGIMIMDENWRPE